MPTYAVRVTCRTGDYRLRENPLRWEPCYHTVTDIVTSAWDEAVARVEHFRNNTLVDCHI